MFICDNCDHRTEEKHSENIPYIVYETEMARNERHTRRWVSAFAVTFILLVASNIWWFLR